MASDIITLYDVPQKSGHKCFSPNVWKTRLVLNYKNLPYQTQWLELPELRPTFEPNLPGQESYTVPTIHLPPSSSTPPPNPHTNGSYITDSATIASALETLHPTPSLHLSSPSPSSDQPLHEVITTHLQTLGQPMFVALASQIHSQMLTPASKPQWTEKILRGARTRGMNSIEEISSIFSVKQGVEMARPVLDEIEALFKGGNGDGKFMLGKEPCYADFVLVAFLEWVKRVDEGVYEEFFGARERLKGVHEGCGEWLGRDD